VINRIELSQKTGRQAGSTREPSAQLAQSTI